MKIRQKICGKITFGHHWFKLGRCRFCGYLIEDMWNELDTYIRENLSDVIHETLKSLQKKNNAFI